MISPGSEPEAWLNYIDWDLNLEKLRAKRCRKLRIFCTGYPSERRVLNTFDRATDRHPGSLEIWNRYLEFAEKVGAGNRWNKVWMRAVRLHTRSADLWIKGGRRMAEDGNMEKARERFLYGCRNCVGGDAAPVWVEYARAEMEWLAKTKEKLQLGQHSADVEDDFIAVGDPSDGEEEYGDDTKKPSWQERAAANHDLAQQLANSSALKGAIPKAIFDIARTQEFFSPSVARNFWDAFASVDGASAASPILGHVVNAMEELYPGDPDTLFCKIRTPLLGVAGKAWMEAMKELLRGIPTCLARCDDQPKLTQMLSQWLGTISQNPSLDARVAKLLEMARQRLDGLLNS